MKRKEQNNFPKVLFAGRYSENSTSGPLQFAAGLFSEYSRAHNTEFIEYFFDGRKYSVIKKLFGLEKSGNTGGIIYRAGIFRIFPLLISLKPEIIHILTFERFAVIFYIYKLFFKVKIFYNSHGVIYYENRILKSSSLIYSLKDRFCEKIFLKFSDRIIFPSGNALDLAEKYYNINENKVLLLANFINTGFFDAKRTLNSSNELKAVYFYKNILNISGLDILKRLINNDTGNVKYFIVTDEPDKIPSDSKASIEILNKIPNDKLPYFYADKDIFLSLNCYDTFSISTGEAMAAGLIPVITEQTGISRYIENGVNGYKFDYNDKNNPAGIIEQLKKMSSDERDKISGNAAKTAAELTPDKVTEIYITEYKAAL